MDDGTKVTFHEVCTRPDWCIVQIVPMIESDAPDDSPDGTPSDDTPYEIGVSLIPDVSIDLPSEPSDRKEDIKGKVEIKGKRITTKKSSRADRRTIRLSSGILDKEREQPKKPTANRQQKIDQFLAGNL